MHRELGRDQRQRGLRVRPPARPGAGTFDRAGARAAFQYHFFKSMPE